MSRTEQPRCWTCNHSQSFHDQGRGRCFAMGCQCEHMPDLRERLDALSRDEVRDLARQVELPDYSSVRSSKGMLLDALVSHANNGGGVDRALTRLKEPVRG